MLAVERNETWDLKDPNDNTVRDSMPARKLWQQILETRYRTGEPYLNFIDTANRAMPQSMKDKGLKIHGSNLCNEIHLPTSSDRTAVCCLSSLNLEKFDEWKNTTLVRDLIRFLDNVLQFFIDNAGDEIGRARYSAKQERSLGLGAMGYHALLQQKRIPFESQEARDLNNEVFKYIKDESVIPDEVYDSLCKRLLDRWNKIEHFHKHLISKEALSAGTGFNMKETDYPERVKSAAKKWNNFYF